MSNHFTPKQPTQELLDYIARNWDILPEEGIVVSKHTNLPIGTINIVDGYVKLDAGSRKLDRAQVIYYGYFGEWPTQLLDHYDRNKNNDRISNLRPTNHSTNVRNAKASLDRTLPVGVYRDSYGFRVQKRFNKTTRFLGRFKETELEEASQLAQLADQMLMFDPQATKEQILSKFYANSITNS